MREISEQELLDMEEKGILADKLKKPIRKWELNKKPKPPETMEAQLKKATDALVSLSQQMQAVVSNMAQVVQNSHNGDTAAMIAKVLPIVTRELSNTVNKAKDTIEIAMDKIGESNTNGHPPVKSLLVKDIDRDHNGFLKTCEIEVKR